MHRPWTSLLNEALTPEERRSRKQRSSLVRSVWKTVERELHRVSSSLTVVGTPARNKLDNGVRMRFDITGRRLAQLSEGDFQTKLRTALKRTTDATDVSVALKQKEEDVISITVVVTRALEENIDVPVSSNDSIIDQLKSMPMCDCQCPTCQEIQSLVDQL